MGESEDSKSKSEAIPMQVTSPVGDKDNTSDQKPPEPPKRDYAAEHAETQQSDAGYASVNKKRKLGSFPTRPQFVYKPENPEAWMSCIQRTLIVFNLFIWLFGAVITALGIWIKVDDEFWNIQTNLDVTQFTSASYVFIIIGIVIMLVGFIGCYGAIVSSICLLVIFSVIVAIVIVLEIAVMAIVWTAASKKSVKEDIKLKATTAMQEMLDNEAKLYFVDLLQKKLQCCGVNGPEDYNIEGNPRPIPNSCTNPATGLPNEKGCYDAVVHYLEDKAAVIGGIAVAVFLLQLGVLIFTTCLICGVRRSVTNSVI